MVYYSFLANIWKTIENIVLGIFAIIPQFMYFIYASIGALLDVFQLLLRKLAGLDVYYIKDSSGNMVEKSGDILKEFLEGIVGINNTYSALTTVFWSMIVFGVIILILSTIFSIIRAHYNYDAKKSAPSEILKGTVKSLFTMAIVPLTVIFGMYLSEITLKTLDDITSKSPSSSVAINFEREALPNIKNLSTDNGEDVYYASYDLFGFNEWTSSTTFSGMMFEIVAGSCNRVRLDDYTATKNASNDNWDNCGIFYANTDYEIQEKVATQIDLAFANCLSLTNPQRIDWKSKDQSKSVIASTLTYGPSAAFSAGLLKVTHFSKFNVGLVWYYYNLWGFDFFIGFAGIIMSFVLLTSIIFGLMKRLVLCIVLFLVNAPIIGVTPLDEGNGFKGWRKMFVSYFIAGYGSVIGMNLFFLILPFLQSISFFNVSILDKLFNMLIILAGLSLIRKIISLVSSFIGAQDLAKEGDETKKATGAIATKALNATLATATTGIKIGSYALGGGLLGGAVKGIHHQKLASDMVKSGRAIDKKQAMEFVFEDEKRAKEDRKIAIRNRLSQGAGKLKKVKSFGYRLAGSTLGKAALNYAGLTSSPIIESREMDITDENGVVQHLNKKETREYRGRQNLSRGLSDKLDISEQTFKLIGTLTGTSQAFEGMKDKPAYDTGKMTVQALVKAIGGEKAVKSMEEGNSKFSTSKQLAKADSKATKEKREKMVERATTSQRMASEIFLITEKIKRLR